MRSGMMMEGVRVLISSNTKHHRPCGFESGAMERSLPTITSELDKGEERIRFSSYWLVTKTIDCKTFR
jgi:hypothetical protein